MSPGYATNLVVFDPTTFDRGNKVRADDLPGGGWRYVRCQRGVHAVVVNGAVAWTAAQGYTGTSAGAVVRTR